MDEISQTTRKGDIFLAVGVAFVMIILAIVISFSLKFTREENLLFFWIFTILYAIFALVLLGSRSNNTREIEKRVYIDRPVVKEVTKPIYIDRPVIKEVEKKVIQRVEVPVIRERKVYLRETRKKLNIPKFNFIGSNETKRFHTRFCRLGKLIKKKNKVHSNSANFFRKKHYKACKACILKSKKI